MLWKCCWIAEEGWEKTNITKRGKKEDLKFQSEKKLFFNPKLIDDVYDIVILLPFVVIFGELKYS